MKNIFDTSSTSSTSNTEHLFYRAELILIGSLLFTGSVWLYDDGSIDVFKFALSMFVSGMCFAVDPVPNNDKHRNHEPSPTIA